MLSLGMDIGSTTSKCVLMNGERQLLAMALVVAGIGTQGPEQAAAQLLENAQVRWEDIDVITATGYGRLRYERAQHQVSELTCHALGTSWLFPQARTVIDIGGQDVKILSLGPEGRLLNFVMNDKCAAGTGRFLDVMANILQIRIDDLGPCAMQAERAAVISSTCTVFAESEVISQLAAGVARNEVIAGICESVAAKTASLAKRLPIRADVVMSGGVARNEGVRRCLEKHLEMPILHAPQAQYTGALGAALYGLKAAD